MAFLKFIFMLLIAVPFALFLLFIIDKLVNEFKNNPVPDSDDKDRIISGVSENIKSKPKTKITSSKKNKQLIKQNPTPDKVNRKRKKKITFRLNKKHSKKQLRKKRSEMQLNKRRSEKQLSKGRSEMRLYKSRSEKQLSKGHSEMKKTTQVTNK